jgi:hypothetical protein
MTAGFHGPGCSLRCAAGLSRFVFGPRVRGPKTPLTACTSVTQPPSGGRKSYADGGRRSNRTCHGSLVGGFPRPRFQLMSPAAALLLVVPGEGHSR